MNSRGMNTTSPDTRDFQDEALFLVNHYADLRKVRDRLKRRLDGSWVFTEDMAVDELVSITPRYGGDHVQSSNISNTTERITDKLMNGYVEQRQAQMEKEKEACRKEYEYVDWKVRVIETAVSERLDNLTRNLFVRIKGNGFSYRELQKRRKTENLYMRDIRSAIVEGVNAVQSHLQLMSCLDMDIPNIRRLRKEAQIAKNEGS